ncbi:TorF family putative porin [Undibacterium sp. RTI2.1]|uniref:TorF family putative porin n=1 Tax=unclassified Undibacterium TaxID=2630295 RepID=UPI002AB47117|nr:MULTISPECIES: TorF family putative porin [unclassified Undibacterium]MDY7539395.1 TorF family putative porin [Undibacterium sp. 5I1]MEB0032905.1 TorF family putative porin [Undibacterium sp. RTI2.1]MEB0118722.1 TorF family putative porin [Undibacterium sp. RTI2.2]MEB0232982.1 TorF family putative porin [Undibacterium sp. 10I3]MEB0258342.1 TorF family putative porin [Undibacterium sp. 5I1]
MKKLLLAVAVAASFGASLAHAEDAKPDNEVSFNIGGVSDYRYRGISQTRLDPALQGGADYTHNPTGFYAGTWLSTIKWTKDAGGSGNVEWDIYGGKRGEIVKDVSYDVGVLSYVYPSNGLSSVPGFANANTTEIYGQLGYGPVYVKYSHSVTNLFGFVNSKNSGYLDIGANVDIVPDAGYTLNLHVGHQTVKNNTASAYTDWKIGVTKEFVGVTFSLAAIATNADEKLYYTPAGKFTGKTSLVFSALKSF